jgi:hypothetical protein
MQKCRITSRRFSWKSTVEYVKATFPVAAPVALTTGITAGITFLLTSYAPLKEISKDTGLDVAMSDLLPSKIKDSEVTTVKYDGLIEDRLFVERPLLLQQIIDIMDRKKNNEKYFVLYGAKGVGKSTIVERAAKGRKGVIMLRVTTAHSREDVMGELAETLNLAEKPKTMDYITALKKGKLSGGILPTIIIEIERSGSRDLSLGVQAARGVAKDLAAACSVIIVLSEANAVLEFGKDRNRENMIFIDELTEPEARKYIVALGLELSEVDIKCVIENVGTNPAALRSMQEWINGKKSINDFVAMQLAAARVDLARFPHKAILNALKEHPEGVNPEYFGNMKSEGVDLSEPFAVGEAMKKSNAIAYRIELGKYMIISHCHQVALRSYDPNSLPSSSIEKL